MSMLRAEPGCTFADCQAGMRRTFQILRAAERRRQGTSRSLAATLHRLRPPLETHPSLLGAVLGTKASARTAATDF